MNVYEAVKNTVTTRQAAEYYEIKVTGRGMARCPFHHDRHPSMKPDRISRVEYLMDILLCAPLVFYLCPLSVWCFLSTCVIIWKSIIFPACLILRQHQLHPLF